MPLPDLVRKCAERSGCPGDGAFRVHLVVVNERAAGRFDHAHAFQGVYAGCCAHMRVENLRIVKESFDAFQGRDNSMSLV